MQSRQPTPARPTDAAHRRVRRRRAWAIGVSVFVHGAAFWFLLPPASEPPPPEPPPMQVELVTPPRPERLRPPPRLPRIEPPKPSRPPTLSLPSLHLPAPQAAPSTVAPLPAFRVQAEPGPQGAGAEPKAAMAKTLRGRLGCDHAELLHLSKKEKEACLGVFGPANPGGPMYAVISPAKKAIFDGDCPPDDDWCLYRIGKGPYPGLLGLGKKKKRDW